MKAVWMKVLSLLLVLVLVANMLPLGVFAQRVVAQVAQGTVLCVATCATCATCATWIWCSVC